MDHVGIALASGDRFLLSGGEPRGGCPVHRTVSKWPGWRRLPRAGTRGGRPCSLFQAPTWHASAVPLAVPPFRVEWEPDAHELVGHLLGELELGKAALDPHPSERLVIATPTERRPKTHQVRAVHALAHMRFRAMLSDDMGLGKTSTALWATRLAGAKRVLVLCPASVKHNWRREVEATLGDPEHGIATIVIDGTPRKRSDRFVEIESLLRHMGSYHQVVAILNYDLLVHLPDQHVELLERFVDGQFLICDEGHYLKGRKAKRTKFVLEHLAAPESTATSYASAKWRLLLSGTPVRNTIEDLWSQVQLIRPGTWSSYNDFANRYLILVPHRFHAKQRTASIVVRGTKNVAELNAIMNTLQIRRKKEDVLDLPPKVRTVPELELDVDTKRIYKFMKEAALIKLAELGDDTPIFQPQARSAVEAALRCEQIAQGFVGGIPEPYMEKVLPYLKQSAKAIPGRPKELIFPRSSKIVWLIDTIDSLLGQGSRPVVFSRFNAPLFWLTEQWEDTAMLHGGLSSLARDDIIQDFQNSKYRLLFCQVKIAEGFNLTNSQDAIFLGRDWSPAINYQAEDRLHRIGTKGTVNIQIPVVMDTLEKLIHRKLSAKHADAEQALRSVTIRELRDSL